MKITNVTIHPIENSNTSVKAFANIVIDDMLAIHGIKIIKKTKEDGLFIAFPSKQIIKIGEPVKTADIVHPITKEARDSFTESILEEYNKYEANKTT